MDDATQSLLQASLGTISIPAIIAGLVFGCIGFAAFMYGRKRVRPRPIIIGIVLMVFPYFVSNVVWQCVIGVALTVGLFFPRD
jgi:hypothetical protein